MAGVRVGNDDAGFFLSVDADSSALQIVGFGFWSRETAIAFFPAVRDALNVHPRVTRLVFDYRNLKPLRDEGQDGFRQVLIALRTMLLPTALVLTSSPLTRLQLLRIVKESGCSDLVEFA
jgi:hypothetical protein